MRSYMIMAAMAAMILVSCKTKPKMLQAKDKDLTLQVMLLDGKDDGSYQARLIPSKNWLISAKEQMKKNLYYKMDSCFYISDGVKRDYARLVQPIANGIDGSYEYLIEFENDQSVKGNKKLIYGDKFITHKQYTLTTTP